ncbi:hypothetical protein TBLA_0B01230 [Henningerozyma blattae CBS 6284]|uniref:50S ribosomal protein L35 n=1 Tax=Henningerozyma blattae (strain ATCC 34711 / CBS 6284 / DSM 70876 / NBRC 10599 / NRRL Y-10934 / UCD 77-7) TaxID=1071380 RepID=I2GXW4_HENB6|nr:hypothetical protein TBLA_0B01230 [Tetrapisispora blattae CBS 6284]CCH58966.1 hypothetical protein TBLA_0B01230 [Tetrapisispora blattae CBS 6284]
MLRLIGLFAAPSHLPAPLQLSLVRGLHKLKLKTHKGTLKRWRRRVAPGGPAAEQFVRSKAGRNHGNIGWSHRALAALSRRVPAHSTHVKALRKLLPY